MQGAFRLLQGLENVLYLASCIPIQAELSLHIEKHFILPGLDFLRNGQG